MAPESLATSSAARLGTAGHATARHGTPRHATARHATARHGTHCRWLSPGEKGRGKGFTGSLLARRRPTAQRQRMPSHCLGSWHPPGSSGWGLIWPAPRQGPTGIGQLSCQSQSTSENTPHYEISPDISKVCFDRFGIFGPLCPAVGITVAQHLGGCAGSAV